MSKLFPISRQQQLRVNVDAGKLTISIGIETLANVIKFDSGLDHYDGGLDEHFFTKVTNAEVFAREVADALEDEESDDGTTLIHRMLDKAALQAIENGAEGVQTGEEQAELERKKGENAAMCARAEERKKHPAVKAIEYALTLEYPFQVENFLEGFIKGDTSDWSDFKP
jgi:hypothetical protein